MADVAHAAGVSHQTVSRVLNGHPNVSDRTRLRVQAAIEELGYRPNNLARALARGHSQAIGLIAPNSTLFGPSSTQAAFFQEAMAAGYAVNVASVRELDDHKAVAEAVEHLMAQRVAAIALVVPVVSADLALETIPRSVPTVLLDAGGDGGTCVAAVDQVVGGRLATEHLLSLGHQTVWHVSGPPMWFDSRGREDGWRQALVDAGREVPPVIPADWTAASGFEAGRLLARMPDVTAVFAGNDHLALGVLRALTESGVRVPNDVSLVGFDDVPEAGYYQPPLTTVRQDFAELARTAITLLVRQMRGDAGPGAVTIEPELIVRSSTGGRHRGS